LITIEDKVELFRKIVLDKINKDFIEKENDFSIKKEFENLSIDKEAKEKSKIFIEKFILKANKTKEESILDANKKGKERILEIKNRLIEEVYQNVLGKCSDFLKEDSYLEVFEKLLKSIESEIVNFNIINVYLVKKDFTENLDSIRNLFKDKFKEKEINFYESDNDFRGGFIIYNGNKSVKLNISLESIITRNKTFIGNEVYKVLKEDGEVNG
jgi:V/A-type H+-transporting ATPase subunit E